MFVVAVAGRARHALTGSAERLALGALESILDSRLAREAVDRVLASALVEHVMRDLVRYRVIERATDELLDSTVVDEAIVRILESEELWVLVDEIASSPAVTDAISHQGAGLADQVAAVVRDRSRNADARLERAARRVLRRDARPVE
jgi:hypothetical protein